MNRTVIVATTRARLSRWVARAALLFAVAGASALAVPAVAAGSHPAAATAPAAVTGTDLMADDPWV